jgi:hypothetical protein
MAKTYSAPNRNDSYNPTRHKDESGRKTDSVGGKTKDLSKLLDSDPQDKVMRGGAAGRKC